MDKKNKFLNQDEIKAAEREMQSLSMISKG